MRREKNVFFIFFFVKLSCLKYYAIDSFLLTMYLVNTYFCLADDTCLNHAYLNNNSVLRTQQDAVLMRAFLKVLRKKLRDKRLINYLKKRKKISQRCCKNEQKLLIRQFTIT